MPKYPGGLELLRRFEDTWVTFHRRAEEYAGARELVNSEVVYFQPMGEKEGKTNRVTVPAGSPAVGFNRKFSIHDSKSDSFRG